MLTNNPSLRNKSLQARNMLNFYKSLRGLCRDMLWLWPIETDNAGYKKYFLSSKKKTKLKRKNIPTTFGKLLFLTEFRMRYAIYTPPNTKDLAINQTMVAYGNRQNAIAFVRADNSDLLRSLKHLMKARLYKESNSLFNLESSPLFTYKISRLGNYQILS